MRNIPPINAIYFLNVLIDSPIPKAKIKIKGNSIIRWPTEAKKPAFHPIEEPFDTIEKVKGPGENTPEDVMNIISVIIGR